MDGEVEDLNLQNQKLKESNLKLEEEIRKMQQITPVDISEVARLRERVRVCDAAGIPEAAESKVSFFCKTRCVETQPADVRFDVTFR